MRTITFTASGGLGKSALRQANERLILNAIRLHEGISRADIARSTGLAPSSVTLVVNRLAGQGLLVEEKAGNRGQLGRRPTALQLCAEARVAVGVEISTSVTRVVLADLKGRVLRSKQIPWQPDPEILLGKVRQAIESLTESHSKERVLGVGVSLPATIEAAGGRVIAGENLGWFGVEVGEVLQRNLDFEFFYDNDANLSALAEQWFGGPEAKLLQNFVAVTLRAGLGTGVVIDGRLLRGSASAGGEFGHTTLFADGRPCTCGGRGCWEQYASAPALCRLFAEKSGGAEPPISADEIVERARAGDAAARSALDETARYLAIGLVNLILGLNPEAVILSDFAAKGWDMIETTVWDVVRARVPGYAVAGLRIAPSRLAADSAGLGAVARVLAQYFTTFGPSKALPRSSALLTD